MTQTQTQAREIPAVLATPLCYAAPEFVIPPSRPGTLMLETIAEIHPDLEGSPVRVHRDDEKDHFSSLGTEIGVVRPEKITESLNTRVDSLEINFDGLTKRVDGLQRMLDDMGAEVHSLEGKLQALEKTFSFRLTLRR
ncbi:hypothetical protein C8R44DRAFT_933194 [Mycena epipterygia]|nr:hypothetical protein C8R44DRAFT_933194 [Mycena epipterygia]